VRVRVPVSWEIIQQFSHLLFGPASFPLRPQFSPDLLPQLWASVFIYLFFRQLSSSLTYSLQGKMKYSQVHPKFLSSPLTKFGSHARERRNILIFPLLISESVGNWLNMQIEFCQVYLYIFRLCIYIYLIYMCRRLIYSLFGTCR